MAWSIEFDKLVRKQVEKLDPQVQKRIHSFLYNHLAKLDSPRRAGEALHGSELGKFWRYKVGDYRVICDIQDHKLVVLVIEIGHRREVYR
ncbi:plasmid stabilization system [Rhizobium sp. CF080]|uniref:type II toxin-antitoxin system RelE family toxin n=1 Tax=Rhizobium sp. (strain CF080) TaxID=1144310 RepID=UPI000271A485|nr:type II toxin-antitoxin system RelE/ParE family toxin [Rhizobium sp. CF080]EUC01437.1 plasmid stabilization system [Rhizobium sp. CF080]